MCSTRYLYKKLRNVNAHHKACFFFFKRGCPGRAGASYLKEGAVYVDFRAIALGFLTLLKISADLSYQCVFFCNRCSVPPYDSSRLFIPESKRGADTSPRKCTALHVTAPGPKNMRCGVNKKQTVFPCFLLPGIYRKDAMPTTKETTRVPSQTYVYAAKSNMRCRQTRNIC